MAPDDRDEAILDVVILTLDGGYPSTAIGPLEVFHSAGNLWNMLRGDTTQPRFRVRVASLDGRAVPSLCGLALTPNCGIADIKRADIIIVPASGIDVQERIARQSKLLPWLRKWHARGAHIAGICTGVAFLAETGLLDGKQATTHWAVAGTMSQLYPKVQWRPEHFVTEDSRLLCSGGVYASLDLSLYLVEKFCGHEIALQCAKSLLIGMPRHHQSGYAVTPLSRPHSDDRIKRVEDFLHDHLGNDISIDVLAERAGMGPRNFIRRFKAATGRLPRAYVQMLRVWAAKEMLEQGATSVQAVSSKIGYDDVAFFRSLFKRHTGMTPAAYREQFAGMRMNCGGIANGTLPPAGQFDRS
ncbi:MAG: helix-turn-helix domain-containing protein [Proteobacteria bacterium]|nr:helix-turn-helix domain-containing protein [Pseudomonadota bacterium]